jgi:hypothetical protein
VHTQEWSQDHLEGAIHIPLPHLLRRIGGFSRKVPLVVACGSGYRSSIAASLLESKGFERLSNDTPTATPAQTRLPSTAPTGASSRERCSNYAAACSVFRSASVSPRSWSIIDRSSAQAENSEFMTRQLFLEINEPRSWCGCLPHLHRRVSLRRAVLHIDRTGAHLRGARSHQSSSEI